MPASDYDKEDTFDLAQALYWYCADNHGGQWSDLYSILSQVSAIYKPGASERGPDESSEGFYNRLYLGELDANEMLEFIKAN